MEPLTSVLILKALDGLSARAVATSHNIANAQSPAFRPQRVTFEQALERAARRGVEAVSATKPMRVAGGPGDDEVRLDQEMGTAAATALRYGALIEVLGRRTQIAALAITGGR